ASIELFLHSPQAAVFHPLSLHDALPIFPPFGHRGYPAVEVTVDVEGTTGLGLVGGIGQAHGSILSVAVESGKPYSWLGASACPRSEEHTSELQSRFDLVCRLLLEKNNVS